MFTAPILSPLFNFKISPTTIFSVKISIGLPSRITVDTFYNNLK